MAYLDATTRLGPGGGPRAQYTGFSAQASAAVSGTLVGALESDIVAGGRTIIITLTADTFVATVGADNAITQALIDGITSAQSESTGWNTIVRDALTFSDVTRDSDTQVTVLLPAFPSYAITADETITVTVPATALTGATELTASPVLTVADTGKVVKGRFKQRRLYVVNIDGRDFVVNNLAQAQSLLKEIRDLAEEQVEKDVPIQVPKITVKTKAGKPTRASGILSEVRKTTEAVKRSIKRQRNIRQERLSVDRQIGRLMTEKIKQEEEAIITLLLM